MVAAFGKCIEKVLDGGDTGGVHPSDRTAFEFSQGLFQTSLYWKSIGSISGSLIPSLSRQTHIFIIIKQNSGAAVNGRVYGGG